MTDVDPQMFSRDCVVAIEASHRQRLEDKADVGRWIYSMTTQFRVDAWFVVHPCHASWVVNGNVESVLTMVLDELDNLTVQPATRSFRPMSMWHLAFLESTYTLDWKGYDGCEGSFWNQRACSWLTLLMTQVPWYSSVCVVSQISNDLRDGLSYAAGTVKRCGMLRSWSCFSISGPRTWTIFRLHTCCWFDYFDDQQGILTRSTSRLLKNRFWKIWWTFVLDGV